MNFPIGLVMGLGLGLVVGCSGGPSPVVAGADAGGDGDRCALTPSHCAAGYTFDGTSCSCVPIADGANGALCSATSQCPNGEACGPGGVVPGCGICIMPTCQTDADCADAGATSDGGPPEICGSVECSCGAGGQCVPGCGGNADCGAGETCAAGHCITPPCNGDADCATDFVCNPTSQACEPKACQVDSDCTGYCVNNVCSTQPGQCAPLPA